jgi:hypothetical protein
VVVVVVWSSSKKVYVCCCRDESRERLPFANVGAVSKTIAAIALIIIYIIIVPVLYLYA